MEGERVFAVVGRRRGRRVDVLHRAQCCIGTMSVLRLSMRAPMFAARHRNSTVDTQRRDSDAVNVKEGSVALLMGADSLVHASSDLETARMYDCHKLCEEVLCLNRRSVSAHYARRRTAMQFRLRCLSPQIGKAQ